MKEPPLLLLRSCRELQERSAFLSARLMAQREPDTVAEPNLVIDPAQVIPDNRLPDAELLSDFTVVEPLCNQLYDAKPAPAGFPGSVSASPAPPNGQIYLYTFVEPESGVQRTPSVSARAAWRCNRSPVRAAGSAVLCSLFLLIPIAANGRTTVRLCSVVATKRCRKHSYHDREIPEQAESLLAEQKPGLGPPPRAPEENPRALENRCF
jgi:hypothetical protein